MGLDSKYLSKALELSSEGILILDTSTNILYGTDKAKDILGLKEDFQIRSFLELFPDSFLAKEMGKQLKGIVEEILPIPTRDRNLFCVCRLEQVIAQGEVKVNILYLKQQMGVVNETGKKSYHAFYTFNDIIGPGEKLEQLKKKGKAFALGDSTVLIQGETGTGKELFAQALHAASPRKDKPFMPVNCAAIPENLLESELFGYEEGSFTGAVKGGKPGRFEIASGGTVFLDEIGDMPMFLQAKLLRVLQEKKIERVGGTRQIPVDVRIIAATHKDLRRLVADNKFRDDLYYRLNVLPLYIPPLRERREDIYVLLEYFLKKHTVLAGKPSKRFSAKVLNQFFNYSWPGNVRELENVIEYMVNLPEQSAMFDMDSLPPYLLGSLEQKNLPGEGICQAYEPDQDAALLKVKDMESNQIIAALEKYGHCTRGKREAAKALGISVATLYRKLKKI